MTDAPRAERRPVELVRPYDTFVDPYAWLRDRDDPATIAHLEAENAYTEEMLGHLDDLRSRLFEEIRARIQETDESAPVKDREWWYLTRTEEGREYPIHCRRRGAPDGPEEIWLDENVLADRHEYFSMGGLTVSPDQRLAAYAVDVDGSEVFRLRFRDLTTGADLPDEIPRVHFGLAWCNDNRSILYTVPDAAWRPSEVRLHVLGTDPSEDRLIHEEHDERFWCTLGRTRSDRFVVVEVASQVTSEVHLLDADDPTAPLRVVAPREQGHEYGVDHVGDDLWIVSNADGATNFALLRAPLASPSRDHWELVVPARDDVKIEAVDAFASFLVRYERAEANRRIVVRDLASGDEHVIAQPEPVHTAGPGQNLEFDTATFRYVYTSLTTPLSVYDYDVATREATLVKRHPVLGDYDPEGYVTDRGWATAPDGVEVPISVVHRRDLPRDGARPTVLYAYGAYEHPIDPGFSSLRLSLLDRGVVFAIAHVRGGGELGRHWYEDGKYLRKRNTFTDLVACAEHLIAAGYTSAEHLAVRGGSAGGLTVGATLNLRPELFRAAVAQVPFVDVVNTILDESLPLSVIEWEEWGNPNEREFFEYIRGYAPYENVRQAEYPALLVTAGLNDPRVSYWEPAKWVAALRETATGDRPILLKTQMGAGHAGPSGRYERWREEAFVMAFLIDQLGVPHDPLPPADAPSATGA